MYSKSWSVPIVEYHAAPLVIPFSENSSAPCLKQTKARLLSSWLNYSLWKLTCKALVLSTSCEAWQSPWKSSWKHWHLHFHEPQPKGDALRCHKDNSRPCARSSPLVVTFRDHQNKQMRCLQGAHSFRLFSRLNCFRTRPMHQNESSLKSVL